MWALWLFLIPVLAAFYWGLVWGSIRFLSYVLGKKL